MSQGPILKSVFMSHVMRARRSSGTLESEIHVETARCTADVREMRERSRLRILDWAQSLQYRHCVSLRISALERPSMCLRYKEGREFTLQDQRHILNAVMTESMRSSERDDVSLILLAGGRGAGDGDLLPVRPTEASKAWASRL
jgi:hypothetical protein